MLFKDAWQLLDSLVFEKKRDSSATEMSHLTTSAGDKMVGAFFFQVIYLFLLRCRTALNQGRNPQNDEIGCQRK